MIIITAMNFTGNFGKCLFAQPTGFTKEVFDLINMARTDPVDFLSKYRADVKSCSPQFEKILENAVPIQKVIWDNGLADMQKDAVENGNLNPDYIGEMKDFRLSSSGRGSSSMGYDPIDLLCEFYTAINDSAESHFGFYYNGSKYSFSWGASLTISSRISFSYEKVPNTSSVDFEKLNTARREIYMSEFERAMIKEINFCRMYPSIYADIVGVHMQEVSESRKGLEKDQLFATRELIKELKNAQPFGILYPKECVYRAAEKHGLDCKKRGFIDHTGTDNSDPWNRISEYCDGKSGKENIVGTVDNNVRQAVIVLLVDQGVSSRGHRYNMLNKEWKYVGCYQYTDENHEWSEYFVMGFCIQNFSK